MKARLSMLVLLVLVVVQAVAAQPGAEFDEYVNKALKDWGGAGGCDSDC